jgi:hypothetical protein
VKKSSSNTKIDRKTLKKVFGKLKKVRHNISKIKRIGGSGDLFKN